jgi:hypothetical protein
MKVRAANFAIYIHYNPDDPNHIDDPYVWQVVEHLQGMNKTIEDGRCADYIDACLQAKEALNEILDTRIEKPKSRYDENFD